MLVYQRVSPIKKPSDLKRILFEKNFGVSKFDQQTTGPNNTCVTGRKSSWHEGACWEAPPHSAPKLEVKAEDTRTWRLLYNTSHAPKKAVAHEDKINR